MRVRYGARWPLSRLITEGVQRRLNALFTFLLNVRRAQLRLQGLWVHLMHDKLTG